MKPLQTIIADFNNTDKENRVRLNTNGSLNDIKTKSIKMKDGLELLLDDGDEFKIKGVVEFSKSENIWVARCDWGGASNLLLSQE
jgi:hypothetical protein